MRKMLAINGSPRPEGSTDAVMRHMSERFRGSFDTEIVRLGSLDISHCRACMRCKTEGRCAVDDDMVPLYGKIKGSDLLVFGSPVYFGAETGLFKNFLDRLYALVSVKDGVRTVDIGRPKKGSVVMTCGAPDGHMTYQGVTVRLMGTMRSLGICDVSSAILPNASPDSVTSSDFFADYMDALDFQMM